jgi:S1-C subfamily serine protease
LTNQSLSADQTNIRPAATFSFRRLALTFQPFAALLACLLAPPPLRAATPELEADVRRDATVAAIEKVLPSVVNIATEEIIPYHDWYEALLRQFYGMRPQKAMNLGSGVIIDEDGYVLTNFHVIRRANRTQVKLWDGREFEADRIVATPGSDVALLRIKAKPGQKFKAIKFAPDDDLLLGETVLALGNPFGLGGSVTKGILSSKNRRPSRGDEPLNVEDWLQTDAAINPGNSGGPLVNLRGELIGLNVAVYREETGERGVGVGFSIPVKQVSAALSRFFTPEITDSLWFGAQFNAGAGPLLVTSVQPGSPADLAGLHPNDLLLQVNGRKPAGLIDCNTLLAGTPEHRPHLLLSRNNEQLALKVRLLPLDEAIQQKLGLSLTELNPETARRFGLQSDAALLIDDVDKSGPAARAELKKGYLITAINGRTAGDLRTAMEILSSAKKGDAVHLTVIVPRRLGGAYFELRQGIVDLQLR